MIKKFLLICVGIFFLSTNHSLNGQTTSPPRTSTPLQNGACIYFPGQDVTYILPSTELNKIVSLTSKLLGTDPSKIWYFYSSGNVTIWSTGQIGKYKVAVSFSGGGASIVLIEIH